MAYVIVWIVCAVIAGAIAQQRGRSTGLGLLLGFLLGPLGIVGALVLKPDAGALDAQQVAAGAMKKCPYCAELVRSDARVCRYCQRDLAAPAGPSATPITPTYQHLRTPEAKPLPYVKITGAGRECSACGQAVTAGAASCPHCGVTFQPAP